MNRPGSYTTEERQRWLTTLARAPLGELEAAWKTVPDKPAYRALRASETGLVMVRGRIGGDGAPFNFGEITVTRAAVQLIGSGDEVGQVGFGHVAGRSVRHAELVALFDALLQDEARRQTVIGAVLSPLAAQQQAAEAAQSAKVMATKVDFFTMVRGE
ncbi:MAG: phosphonate C-P lyase system protein PhnG [Alphaproteobacteria bacterium]|nr:phosphonate C-P lyase system protein PhnG [Alphaproteobacteria bacterium]